MNHTDIEPLHIVDEGRIRSLITRLLRRAPHALCGELMLGDPNQPDCPSPYSPLCPACVKVTGMTEDKVAGYLEYVPGCWI